MHIIALQSQANRMENQPKGTVTPLASTFPIEEAQKAARRVEESLEEPRKEIQKLKEFIDDNRKLMKLVQKLPDELSHNIMVPFGKAAFFPGRMIHTNELLVLLGGGYYAERTAKQTLDVLRRRAKVLESKVEGVKAVMEDLHAEASFFTSTAAEAAAGIMEIREDYVEDSLSKERPDSLSAKLESGVPVTAKEVDSHHPRDDNEYDRIMSRLSELEQEEDKAEAENNSSSSEENEDIASESGREDDTEEEESEDEKVDMQPNISMEYGKGKQEAVRTNMEASTSKTSFKPAPRDWTTIRSPTDISKFEDWKTQSKEKDHVLLSELPVQEDLAQPSPTEVSNAEKEVVKLSSFQEIDESPFLSKIQAFKDAPVEHEDKGKADSRKAFTGLIVEHGTSEVKGSDTSQAPVLKPSRPVSRFKMQKANR